MLGEVLKAGSLDASWGFLGSVRLSREHLCSFISTQFSRVTVRLLYFMGWLLIGNIIPGRIQDF